MRIRVTQKPKEKRKAERKKEMDGKNEKGKNETELMASFKSSHPSVLEKSLWRFFIV